MVRLFRNLKRFFEKVRLANNPSRYGRLWTFLNESGATKPVNRAALELLRRDAPEIRVWMRTADYGKYGSVFENMDYEPVSRPPKRLSEGIFIFRNKR